MKKILVPTDFSDCSGVAERYALEIARKLKAEIHFIHAVYAPVEWVKLPIELEKNYPETKAIIAEARHQLGKRVKEAESMGLNACSQLVYNRGREELMHYIEVHGIAMVVMGSHGAEGLKEILGSNAQMMVRYAKVPVLVVKKGALVPKMHKIVFASTFNPQFVPVYQNIKTIATALGAELYLLKVNTPYEFMETTEAEEHFERFLTEAGEKGLPFHHFDALNEERGITQFAERHGIDIIALATRSRGDLARLVSPGVTESLVNHTVLPVLSVK